MSEILSHTGSASILMFTYLVGTIVVLSICALLEKKLGHETFLGYGLDFLVFGSLLILQINLVTYAELVLMLLIGVKPFEYIVSLTVFPTLAIGFVVGSVHTLILVLIAAVNIEIIFGCKSCGHRIAPILDASESVLKLFGGIMLFLLVAHYTA